MGGMLLFSVFHFKLLKLRGSTTNATRLQSMVNHLDLTKASAKFEIATSNGLGGDAFTIKYIISPLNLPNILYIILSMHLQSLKLLCPTV